ncbi:tetratricopeptide repeat protein [Bordetella genomosp. 9]|nr:tetratricopeptide repeat protein [Bordetella genomosp. 9]
MRSVYSKSIAGSMLLSACLLLGGNAYAAEATPDQVYQAAQAGNYREAQAMMDQILRDHPNSAKAHFVEAELLGKQGKLQQAQAELNTAIRLDPSQNFARPGAVDELRSLIASSGNASRAQGTFSGIPWGMVLAIAGLLIVVSLVMRARRRANGAAGPNGGYGPMRTSSPYGPNGPYGPQGGAPGAPQGGYGYPGGAAPGQAGPGMGSGILGGLATGAAVGAGVVAGEALMDRVLHRGSDNAGNLGNADPARGAGAATAGEQGYDMGGNDFGLRDASSWDDDEKRKLANNDGGDNSWNVGNPWDDGGSSSDGGSWDDGSSSGSDDWT